MVFTGDGQLIGAIPFAIELREFKVEAADGATRFRIVSAEGVNTSIYYADGTAPVHESNSLNPSQ